TIDDIKICHLGDLGHDLSDEQMAELRAVDILLIPVGGSFTIDAKAAAKICDEIRPRVAIPMHFKNDKCAFPIAGVEDFLQGRPNVSRFEGSEVEFAKENLPPATTTLVLRHAL
ncbi:MAG: MBL fold metallo-hydrolase, partial [Chloroflexi bacterium]|nr:MBL fold metallo-hydrolase [Chloroflexota bacterium]